MSAPISGGSNPSGMQFTPTPLIPAGPVFGFQPGLGRPHIGIPLPHAHGQVQGYMMPTAPQAGDALTRAAAKFQAFYDALAPDEQEIIELLVERAAGAPQ